MIEIDDGDGVTWRFADEDFLRSNWTCIWGRGCLGIHGAPAPHLADGCCSVGAVLDGPDEAMAISALAATIAPERFQHHAEADAGGVFADDTRTATRVVDGACIFLNRPGFAGGAGCALHLEAVASAESPMDWKPSVCWQLPIRVDWDGDGDATTATATVRRWSRDDWDEEGETMAWWCTEAGTGPEPGLAFVGDRPVVESLGDELAGIVGTEVYVELRRRLT